MHPIHDYYQSLAATYDQDRFANSYGRYVDSMERAVLRRWLRDSSPELTVDIACGTGRLLDFAHTGVDLSSAMLEQAQAKWPSRHLVEANAANTGLQPDSFQSAICFHLLMHLDPTSSADILREAARIVQRGGRLIFDIPSKPRRGLSKRPPSGWHGDHAASIAEVRRWADDAWRLKRWCGVLFVPVHRIPSRWRSSFAGVDALIGQTVLARWSSYYVCELERI